MAGTIGEVDILVGADATPFQKSIDKVTKSIAKTVTKNLEGIANSTPKQLGKMLTSMGGTMQSAGKKLTSYITKPIGGAVVAAGALTTALGFKRLVGIDTARGQFKGLGLDADAVMKQVDAGVTNTALSMAQGASMAVGILATGAVPLEGLEAQIKRVANVSAAYNVDSEQAAYLLNNVLTKQKVTWGDLSQMQRNQIPIVSQLADHYGVAGDEIMKMAQDGLISVEALNEVIDKNAGLAALEYAKTWTGVTKNIISNVGKIGAKLMEPSFEIVKEKAADFLTLLQSPEFAAWADKWGKIIGDFVENAIDKISQLIDWWNNLSPTTQKVIGVITALAVAAGPLLTTFGKITSGVGALVTRFPALGTALSNVAKGLLGASGGAGGLASTIGRLAGPIGLAVTALIAMWQNSETFREGITQLLSTLWELVQTIASALMPVFDALMPIITLIAELIGNVLGAALELIMPLIVWLADLIGTVLVVAADLLVQAIDWLVDAFTEGGEGANALGAAWEWLQGVFDTVSSFLIEAWENVKTSIDAVVQWFDTHVGPVFESVGNLISAIFERVGSDASTLGEWLEPLFTWIGELWNAFWESVKETWEVFGPPVIEFITTAFEVMGTILGGIWDGIVAIFEIAWDVMKVVVETTLAVISGIIDFVTAAISGDWNAAWEAIKSIFTAIWDGIKKHVDVVFNGVSSFISGVLDTIQSVWNNIWEGIGEFFSNVWTGIKTAVQIAIAFVQAVISQTVTNIQNTWNNVWNAISTFFSNVWNGIKIAASNFMNAVKNTFENVINFVRDVPGKILGFFSNMGTMLLDAGRALVDGFLSGIMSAWDNITSWVSGAMENLRGLWPFSPAKWGPFSGRGYVTYAGQAIGQDFGNSLRKSLNSQDSVVEKGLDGIADLFTDLDDLGANVSLSDLGLDLSESLADGLLNGMSDVQRAAQELADAIQIPFDELGTNVRVSSRLRRGVEPPAETARQGESRYGNDNSRSLVIEAGAFQINNDTPERTSLDILDRIVEELSS